MVYVRLIREESNKVTCETLNLYHGEYQGSGIDRIVLSLNPNGTTYGYRVTKEDFDLLFERKRRAAEAESEKKKTDEEEKKQKEIEELKAWKAEMGGKNFIQQVASLWKLRKQKTGGGKE